MNIFSLRISDNDKKVIENYAKLKGIPISELLRNSVLEKIEDEIDIDLYNQAMQEYSANPEEAILFGEAMKELGLNG